jgi:hypothetical protein
MSNEPGLKNCGMLTNGVKPYVTSATITLLPGSVSPVGVR